MVNHFERAELLYQQHRYDLALQELYKVFAADPSYAPAYALRGMCLGKQGEHETALSAVETAISLEPSYAWYHYLHALIFWTQEQLAPAHAAIKEALRLDPEDVDFYECQAGLYYDQGLYLASLQSAQQGLTLNPEHQGCLTKRLLALMFLETAENLAAETRALLAAEPNNPIAHAVAGWTAIYQHRIPDACTHFRESLRLKPDYEWARLGMIEALKSRNFIYRMIRTLDNRRWALWFIPQLWLFLAVIKVIMAVGKVFFTLLLSLDPYGRLILTPTEQRLNRWHLAGLVSVCFGAALGILSKNGGAVTLLPSLWLGAYCLWRVGYLHHPWAIQVCLGFLFGLTLVFNLWSIAAMCSAFQNTKEILVGIGAFLLMLLMGEFAVFLIGWVVAQIIQAIRGNAARKVISKS